MKKYLSGLLAVILAVSASAFTAETKITEQLYYLDSEGQIQRIESLEEGTCLSATTEYCKYVLKEGREESHDVDDFDPIGSPNEYWFKY